MIKLYTLHQYSKTIDVPLEKIREYITTYGGKKVKIVDILGCELVMIKL